MPPRSQSDVLGSLGSTLMSSIHSNLRPSASSGQFIAVQPQHLVPSPPQKVLRWYDTSGFEKPDDSLSVRQEKCAAVGLVLAFASLMLTISCLLGAVVASLGERYLGLVLWCAGSGAVMLASLLYMRATQEGLSIVRWVFSVSLLLAPVPVWYAAKASSLALWFASHAFVILSFTLMGGNVDAWAGGRGMTGLHVLLLLFCHLYDYARYTCNSLHQIDRTFTPATCGVMYATSIVYCVTLDLAGHGVLSVLWRRLDHERMVADALLDNCLPRAISSDIRAQISCALTEASRQRSRALVKEHLRAQPELIGFHIAPTVGAHQHVSVLFADICGFTAATSQISPEALVSSLRTVFQEIDWMCIRAGVEKIKTIGDCYMACGNMCLTGTPSRPGGKVWAEAADGARSVVQLGLSLTNMEHLLLGGYAVEFRIGVHTGALVSGVIGLTKFSFDVWGDTVNIASRMESTGVPRRVQVSEATHELTQNDFRFEAREVDVKGRDRPVKTYLVDMLSDDLASQVSMGEQQAGWVGLRSLQSGGALLMLDVAGRRDSQSPIPGGHHGSVSSAHSGNPLVIGPSFFNTQNSKAHGYNQSRKGSDTGSVSSRSSVRSSRSARSTGNSNNNNTVLRRRPAPCSPSRHNSNNRSGSFNPQWASVDDNYDSIAAVLAGLGLSGLTGVFEQHSWSLQGFTLIQPEDLDKMGITAGGDRRLILSEAEKYATHTHTHTHTHTPLPLLLLPHLFFTPTSLHPHFAPPSLFAG